VKRSKIASIKASAELGVIASPRSLKTAQKPHSAAIDKRRLITGITGPYKMEVLRKEHQVMLGQITVKIVRAHGGCLGTKSR
jgi:hypothetical protein